MDILMLIIQEKLMVHMNIHQEYSKYTKKIKYFFFKEILKIKTLFSIPWWYIGWHWIDRDSRDCTLNFHSEFISSYISSVL